MTRDRIDEYLDGMLEGDDLARFERLLGEDPSLRNEVEIQRRIDESIRRTHTPGEASPAPAKRTPRVLRIAAVVALVALSVWFIARQIAPSGQPDYTGAVGEYRRQIDNGFRPRVVCDTDEAFIAYMTNEYGVPARANEDPGVRVLGWDYSWRVLGTNSGVLLAEVEGEPVVVHIDRAENDKKLKGGRGLSLFKRDLAGLVLYEVTPLDTPRVLPLIEPVGP